MFVADADTSHLRSIRLTELSFTKRVPHFFISSILKSTKIHYVIVIITFNYILCMKMSLKSKYLKFAKIPGLS